MKKGIFFLFFGVFLMLTAACGGGSNSSESGKVQVSLTDAPAYGYDSVWITVKDIWFHPKENGSENDTGWLKFPLAEPVSVDLLELGNGKISTPVWNNIELPEGTYEQIRVILAGTEDVLTQSAQNAGLTFNNQVNVTDDATAYPLRVPDARRGIVLTGNFQVKKDGTLKLAVDFDAGHDVVKIERNGKAEFILKPRLVYFDLDNAGAITGHIDAAAAKNKDTAQFVIKAEQIAPDGSVHVVRRATFVADAEGSFVLYPLAPGTYDIVIRGINYQTVIIKNVPVTKGTTPATGSAVIPTVTMTAATNSDYMTAASITSPTGAWVHFYQTLPGAGEVPYEIRFRHFNPLTGTFTGFPLSSEALQVGTYDPSAITLSSVIPVEGNGGFKAVAGAALHERSGAVTVNFGNASPAFGTLTVLPPVTNRRVSGTILLSETFAPGTGLDRGILFAVHGGMIVNAINIDSQMASGGNYTIANIPGGTPEHPLPGAFYGIEAIGWKSATPVSRAIAIPRFVDLSKADASDIDLNMIIMP